MLELEISRSLFGSLIDKGIGRLDSEEAAHEVSFSEPITATEISDCGIRILTFDPQTMATPDVPTGNLEVHFCRSRSTFLDLTEKIRTTPGRSIAWLAWMLVGVGDSSGHLAVFLQRPGSAKRLVADSIRLVGPGMEQIKIRNANLSGVWRESGQIWSRSQEAMGHDAWERLVTSRILIIGAGRSGSLFVQSLANLGVRKMVVIDPDRIEPHNLDGGPLFGVDGIGEPKAEMVAQRIEHTNPWSTVTPLVTTAGSAEGIQQITSADVVISAVDSQRSLFQIHALTRIYGRTLVTVGTRIRQDNLGLDVAVDVGLFYGGQPGCLLCVGGNFPDFHGVRRSLAYLPESLEQFEKTRRTGDFRTERNGSLLSLNSMAVGCALYSLQSAFGGGAARNNRAHITRMAYEEDGQLATSTTYAHQRHATGECLCSMVNTGDHGLELLREYARRSRLDFSHRMR